jgi:hypothetical protein
LAVEVVLKTGLLPAETTGMQFFTWNWIAVLVTSDQTICFQAFEQLLFKLFAAAFALLLHLVTNMLFITSKLSKQNGLDHHDLHDSNKETQSDYIGGWQQHCSKVATAKTGQQWYKR